MIRPTLDPIAQDLLAVLPQLNRIIAAEVRREVGGSASVAQLRLLTELDGGPQTLSAIARQQHVSPQALCVLANDLVERGWLERTPHPHDRRQHLLEVTDRGRDAFALARERALQQITPLLSCLSEDEAQAIRVALPALRRVLGAHDVGR
ncbi:MarR family transcriptional regulator [Oscillochloris sp. ZM17-4]|uniref:MarR family winged helix-turn-helix transcriptional regulator n=1 Tax=Oscillochloris sp. ZM17-4 TaxID=2866714 RepID=UPI001C72E005|nr:MarR family transcriptional regulator [Oscillochloris sp. ZM17-4]MBX0327055.1 MarR family transcriptional regulator [Oscillochloris sp. ZM17-4]